jgi:hypothetical protein
VSATEHPARKFTVAEVTTVPAGIREGDVLPGPAGWVALGDAHRVRGGVAVDVRYTADGGTGTRLWAEDAAPITVERIIR